MAGLNQGFEYRKRLSTEAAGMQVIEYLVRRYPRFSRPEWQERIRSGRVLLDGMPSREHEILTPGRILSWKRPPWEEPDVPLSFAILHQDADLVAVAKPRGLPTIPAGGCFLEHTLLWLVRVRFPGASPLHRLGRGTSGIVLFAKTSRAFSGISQEWNTGKVVKIYRALAGGCLDTEELEVNVPIGPVPHPILRTVHAASPTGKPALSYVRLLERRGTSSLVEVRITTGRPHQIRIHLAAAGHPLVGDQLYGMGGVPADGSRALPGDPGYWLHAGLLGFRHPVSGAWTEIACMPPPVLRLREQGPCGQDQESMQI